jgi:hypothetical protein
MTLPGYLRVEGYLDDALSIAQVDEYQPAMVPPPVNPPGQGYLAANMLLIQFSAAMSF